MKKKRIHGNLAIWQLVQCPLTTSFQMKWLFEPNTRSIHGWYIYLHKWLIFVGQSRIYQSHGSYGMESQAKQPGVVRPNQVPGRGIFGRSWFSHHFSWQLEFLKFAKLIVISKGQTKSQQSNDHRISGWWFQPI